MIRIRRPLTSALPADSDRVGRVQAIFRESYGGIRGYAEKIPALLVVSLGFDTMKGDPTGGSPWAQAPWGDGPLPGRPRPAQACRP